MLRRPIVMKYLLLRLSLVYLKDGFDATYGPYLKGR